MRPESRGSIHIRSATPGEKPAIRPNYLSTPGDRAIAAQSIRLTRDIVARPAMAPFRPEEFKPGAQFVSDADLAVKAGDIATTIFHPVGTAKMGDASDPTAVVDARLRVHGIAGLRVVDASVMPTITSGNTNSPVIMIAAAPAQSAAKQYNSPAPPLLARSSWPQPRELCAAFHEVLPPPCRS